MNLLFYNILTKIVNMIEYETRIRIIFTLIILHVLKIKAFP